MFDGNLPPCLITFQRGRYAPGYFWAGSFLARKNSTLRTDKIARNPDTFVGRSDKMVMSMLVMEWRTCGKTTTANPTRNVGFAGQIEPRLSQWRQT